MPRTTPELQRSATPVLPPMRASRRRRRAGADNARLAAETARAQADAARAEADAARVAAEAKSKTEAATAAAPINEKAALRAQLREQLNVVDRDRTRPDRRTSTCLDTGRAELKAGAREKLSRIWGCALVTRIAFEVGT